MSKMWLPPNHPLTLGHRGWPSEANKPPTQLTVQNRQSGLSRRHSYLLLGKDVFNPPLLPGVEDPDERTVAVSSFFGKIGADFRQVDDRVRWAGFEAELLREQVFTLWAHVRFYDAPWGWGSNQRFCVFDCDNWRFNLGTSSGSSSNPGTLSVRYYNSNSFRNVNTSIPAAGGEFIIHVTRDENVGTQIFVNGVLAASDAITGPVQYASNRGAALGTDYAGVSKNAEMNLYGFGYSPEVWADAEIAQHARDVYSVFTTPNQSHYAFPGEAAAPGPAPVLSNIEATSITTNSVVPQVDITFG